MTVIAHAADNLPQVVSFVLCVRAQWPGVQQFLSQIESLFRNAQRKATSLSMEVDKGPNSVLIIL